MNQNSEDAQNEVVEPVNDPIAITLASLSKETVKKAHDDGTIKQKTIACSNSEIEFLYIVTYIETRLVTGSVKDKMVTQGIYIIFVFTCAVFAEGISLRHIGTFLNLQHTNSLQITGVFLSVPAKVLLIRA